MSNSKRCKHEDRLSGLPNSLIFEIFWLLPMSDVVRTSVLSKRWRNLWTSTPFLNFDNCAMSLDANRLRNFVNRALLSWKADRVLKFKFHSPHKLVKSMFRDIDLWVGFARRNGVEALYLHVLWDSATRRNVFNVKEDAYSVPQCLHSCSSLKVLVIEDCNFEIFGSVEWNQLESLRIEGFRVTAHAVNQLLLGSPRLRVFKLKFAEKGENLSIQSTSLKELVIMKYISNYQDISVVSELRIFTPNLDLLVILGVPYSKCLLMDVSSLTRAILELRGARDWDLNIHDLLHGLQLQHRQVSRKYFYGNAFSQILPSIRHVKHVKLLHCCTKELGVVKMKYMHSSFPNVKLLELQCRLNDYEQVVGLLQFFPQLERLVLKDENVDNHRDERVAFEANLPKSSFVLQLRIVEITWAEGDGVFQLIEFLLQYARKLEKIVFQIKITNPPAPSDSLYLVSRKLLGMRRSSPNCTIDLTRL